MKKAEAKVVKCAKNKSWVPRNPPPLGHLSVNHKSPEPQLCEYSCSLVMYIHTVLAPSPTFYFGRSAGMQ